MKKILVMALAASLALSLAACGGKNPDSSTPKGSEPTGSAPPASSSKVSYDKATVVVGDIYNETTTQGQALNAFKEYVETTSGGVVSVDIYHGGSLGSEGEHAQAQLEGSMELIVSGTAGSGLCVLATSVFESCYAIYSVDDIAAASVSVQDTLDQAFTSEGFKLLGCYYDGPRQILSNKPITSINDLKGLKLRAPGSAIYVNSITAVGANAISMALGDVYTSLQTGAIDAMEGTMDLIIAQKFYEQAKYLIQDSHVYQPLFITYNLNSWNQLNADTQQLILDGVAKSEEVQLELHKAALEGCEKTLLDDGLEIMTLTDRDKWVEAISQVSSDYAGEYGELGQAILQAIQGQQK